MIGTVKHFIKEKRYGFIEDEGGETRFFHISNVEGKVQLQLDDIVSFEPYKEQRGLCATSIKLIGRISDLSQRRDEYNQILSEILEWRTEAKLEDNQRYFFHTRTVDLIQSGRLCYVIGRKGTGKTAICEHLTERIAQKYYAKKLTFKNFPFNELYQYSNSKYTRPNQYITLWKYIIYSELAQLLIKNNKIDYSIREQLKNIYSDDLKSNLQKRVSRWTSREFNLNILGSGAGYSTTRDYIKNETSWIDRVEILEYLLLKHIDNSTYLIAFDELDEDYKFSQISIDDSDYMALLTSLFKAVQDIMSVFDFRRYNIRPVIFLRDDIFDQIKDPDRMKWFDLSVDLNWSYDQLKNLLAFRMSRALNPRGNVLPFDVAWTIVFGPQAVKEPKTTPKSSFGFICNMTQLRPRDFIRYMRICAEAAINKEINCIDINILKSAEKIYSTHFRGELEDEIGGILPEIKEIFQLLASLQKQNFPIVEFTKAYELEISLGRLPKRDYRSVLEVLFNFSVIGYLNLDGNAIFRYLHKDAQYNSKAICCIHRGLYKSLQI